MRGCLELVVVRPVGFVLYQRRFLVLAVFVLVIGSGSRPTARFVRHVFSCSVLAALLVAKLSRQL